MLIIEKLIYKDGELAKHLQYALKRIQYWVDCSSTATNNPWYTVAKLISKYTTRAGAHGKVHILYIYADYLSIYIYIYMCT